MKILNLPDELQTQVYLPETIDECRKISCTDCICLSHRQEGCPCQFNVYLATHAARKTAEPSMLKGCVKGTAKPSSQYSNYKSPEQRLKEAEEKSGTTARYQEYVIEQEFVKADEIKDETVYIPNTAILPRHVIVDPNGHGIKRDLIHMVTWLKPVK